MTDAILVINAGSSSIKFSIFRAESLRRLCHGQIESVSTEPRLIVEDANGQTLHDALLEVEPLPPIARPLPHLRAREQTRHYKPCIHALADWIDAHDDELTILAVCHRVVHGGRIFDKPVEVHSFVMEELETLIPLAPLHQPHNLEAIRIFQRRYGLVPQIAFFDTAFHATVPEVARQFAIPRELTQEGIERYGFHGISYEYIAHMLPEYARDKAEGRVIAAHLGNGASLCAMVGRQSVATTMGFTALDGLMMGTRCGTIDPGVVIYLIEEKGMSPDEVAHMLYHDSGLKGVSTISHDMRQLLTSDAPEAEEAIHMFTYRCIREIGSLTAAMGGLDMLVFTAGIGEHSHAVRRRICEGLGWLGLELDDAANRENKPLISTTGSKLATYCIPTDEERMMAMQAWDIVNSDR